MASRKQIPAHNLKTTRAGKLRKRSFLWRWRRILFSGAVLAVAAFAGVAWVLTQVDLPPSTPPQRQTSFICLANITSGCNETNAVASLHGRENRVEVTSLKQVPKVVQDSVLAAEDRTFFKHGGIDPSGIARAAWADLTSGEKAQGGSTITQQYVRNVYLTQKRTWARKLKEAVLAVKIEQKLPKREIFRRYLNTVYFGRGAYGIQTAAKAYFGVSLDKLNLPQAAYLAGIIRSPDTDPLRNTKDPSIKQYAVRLRNDVLDNMVKSHFISPAARKLAEAVPITAGMVPYVPTNGLSWLGGPYGPDPNAAAGSEYFVDYVRRQLIGLVGSQQAYGGGLRVYTTLQPDLQGVAYQKLVDVLHNSFTPQPQAALTSINTSGQIVAMVSGDQPFGPGPGQSQVNLNLGKFGGGGGRQPGSTFKAFALSQAMKDGYSLYSGFNAPTVATYPWYTSDGVTPLPVHSDPCPNPCNLVTGTAESVNNVFVPLMHDLGPGRVSHLAYRMGIQPRNSNLKNAQGKYSPALVLGTGEVAPMEMASAYSTFMDGGQHLAPTGISKITDSKGNVIWQASQRRTQVLTPEQNGRVVYALQQVLISGTAAGKGLGYDAAGKTGTTDNNADGWFIGFTPGVDGGGNPVQGLTTSVWMGYPDGNRPMPGYVYGATYPNQIWREFMQAALANVDHPHFPTVDLNGGRMLNGEQAGGPGSSTTYYSAPSTAPPATAPPVTEAPTTTPTTPAPTAPPTTATPPTQAPPVSQPAQPGGRSPP